MSKLCECGCGKETNIITKTDNNRGIIRGQYNKFIVGHNKSTLGKKYPIELYPNQGMRLRRLSKDSRQKSSETWKKKYENGYINPLIGTHQNDETKRKNREKHLGKNHSQKTIEKMERNNGKYIRTKEIKEKSKEIWNKSEYKEFARQNRAKQILPNKDTSIEVKIQDLLRLFHIEFMSHYYIENTNNKYRCDIFIPSKNLVIECDGCYWHGCPICKRGLITKKIQEQMERDILRTKELEDKGYKIIRLWEHDIRAMELNDLKNRL